MRTPFISVIVPARNCEDAIGDCLSSLLRLEYPADRLEILAVDNASTDRTGEIIKTYPVRYAYEPRRGPSAARNRGIEASRGEILAFIDADCVATPRWLAELVPAFADEEVSGVAGEVGALDPKTPAERYVALRRPRLQEMVLRRDRPYAGTANIAFRRQTFDAIGLFDPAITVAEDKDFGWRLSAARLRLEYNASALVLHRHRKSAWKLFVQFVGWGYGHALVHRKHRPGRRLHGELPDVDLPVAFRRMAAALLRYSRRGGDRMDVWYPYLDLVRRVGLRLGAAYGLLKPRL